jgi:precorrin-6B C5,15-methyltransferase / cobalt-precorrin-6B C5,C15-methyltransferase
MKKWLAVVGIGEDGLAGLSNAARAAIAAAETLVGAKRHHALVPHASAQRIEWASPLGDTLGAIEKRRGTNVVVLATGDPMWFGIGATLLRHFPADEVCVLPHLSAFALAASAQGWALADVASISLHGRPISTLALHLHPTARILALTADGQAPHAIASFLVERGFGSSRISIFEHLGGPRERHFVAIARDLPPGPYADLNTLAIECVADADAKILSRVAGLPDAAYEHDGQLTKREVRAATLAALAPLPGQTLWDVGAGNGSIAIEWLRAVANTNAIAIERDAARLGRIARNAQALGVPHLQIVAGAAPAAFAGLPAPDAIFVGGGLTTPGLVAAAWQALRPGGMFVANAVTLEGESVLAELHKTKGGEMARLAIARAETVGPHRGWRPAMSVTQWTATKP